MNNGSSITAQHIQMDDVAEATGGRAYYNNNGLSQVAAEIITTDASFYTLTYTPRNAESDTSWHRVRVEVDGAKYQLSYRRGYYAGNGDTDKTALGKHASAQGSPVSADGLRDALPDQRSAPILFEAHVLDATTQKAAADSSSQKLPKGMSPYTIRYSIPAEYLTPIEADGQQRVMLGIVAIAFDQDGLPLARRAQKFTFALNEDKLRAKPHAAVTVDQQVDLRKGQTSPYLAVWDMRTGRLGTLQWWLNTANLGKP